MQHVSFSVKSFGWSKRLENAIYVASAIYHLNGAPALQTSGNIVENRQIFRQ